MSPLEAFQHGGGWRVEAKCKHCRKTVYLDSEEEPSLLALKLAAIGVLCDECDHHHERAYVNGELEARVHFESRVRNSGLPAALQSYDWRDMDRSSERRTVVAGVRAWCESRAGKVLVYGPVGTGKTRLAATAAWERLRGGPCVWCSVPTVMQHQFADRGSPERKHAQAALAGSAPLILDDLGKEKPGDWSRQVLFGAIDSRIQAGTPILITSNFDPDELAERLGDAVGSRLREFHQFLLPGRDRRQPPASTDSRLMDVAQ